MFLRWRKLIVKLGTHKIIQAIARPSCTLPGSSGSTAACFICMIVKAMSFMKLRQVAAKIEIVHRSNALVCLKNDSLKNLLTLATICQVATQRIVLMNSWMAQLTKR